MAGNDTSVQDVDENGKGDLNLSIGDSNVKGLGDDLPEPENKE